MIIKNHLGLEVSVDDAKIEHVVSKYGGDLELIYKCNGRKKTIQAIERIDCCRFWILFPI